MATDIGPNEEDEYYDDLDLASDQVFELDPLQIDAADTPDWIYDYINRPYEDFGIDYSQLEQDILTGTDDSLLIGDDGDGGYSVTDSTPEYPDTVYGTNPSRGRYLGSSGIFTPGRGGSFRIGPNVSFPVGPFLAGGAAVTLTGDDDEETTVPAILPGNDDMDETTTTDTTPTYTLDPMGRIIPSAMATGDTPGTLKELQNFFNMYGGPEGMGAEYAQQMADVTGAGQTAYAQQVLGMEGEDISAFDIAQEASRQQRGALGDVFGLGPDATYADITAAGTAPMEALTQVRETVLPGLQSAFGAARERLEKGLSGRQLQDVQQQARARFGNRLMDTAAFAGEVTDVASEDAGLFSRSLQDLLGIGGTTGALIGQEAYAMSPFTQAAIGSADLGPGLALAGDIGRQAAAATPSPTDIFGLEAGERQFALDQQGLQEAGKAGRFDVLASILSAGASGFRGGPMAGLQQQNLGTPPYFPQQSQAYNPFRYF